MFKNLYFNDSYFMKLNDIDFDKLSDNELKGLCIKYKIIDPQKINLYKRNQLLEIIKKLIPLCQFHLCY